MKDERRIAGNNQVKGGRLYWKGRSTYGLLTNKIQRQIWRERSTSEGIEESLFI